LAKGIARKGNSKHPEGKAAISEVGLELWSGQATYFLAGRQACFLIAWDSLAKSKRRLQAHRQRIRWRPVQGHL
jgi:hypothetical protein